VKYEGGREAAEEKTGDWRRGVQKDAGPGVPEGRGEVGREEGIGGASFALIL